MVFGFGSAEPTEEEKQAAVKTLLERLNDGTQPVAEQLKEVCTACAPIKPYLCSCLSNAWHLVACLFAHNLFDRYPNVYEDCIRCLH